ncbi:MAG: CRTAC1 family protein [Thermoanaerobaculia bacterium]|nr:CRTAC1 family protein [Thermoanaerobaculia bacterium]
MNEKLRPDVADDDELVPEDDAVIGRALRKSLVVLLGIAALGALLYLTLRRGEAPAPETEITATAPVAVEHAEAPAALPFTDVTQSAGITFVHVNGAEGDKLLPETMGGGVAFFDYDGDGDSDLLLVNGTWWPGSKHGGSKPTSALYRNDSAGGEIRFTDVTREAGLDFGLYGMGAAVGDYDGDGNVDLFLTAVGKNHLLRNLGGRFEDVTDSAGVGGDPATWSSSAGFFDYDGDGDLDLFVGNYVVWSREIDFETDYRLTGVGRAYGPPVNYEGTFSYLYRNDGAGSGQARFTDARPRPASRSRTPPRRPVGKALGLALTDVDADGRTDVMVANDTVQNFFFHNRGAGDSGVTTFEEVGEIYGLAYGRNGEATGAMGIDVGHPRNDGEVGFVIGNFANEMTSFYISQGDPTLYADEAISEGIGAPSRTMLSFGILLFDVDLDGRLDVLQANGHLESEINKVDPSQTYEQPAQLFWNAGPEARQPYAALPAEATGDLGRPIVGRGSAFADVDGDGDLDVVLAQIGRAPLLLRNDQKLGHHWLRVRLVAAGANRHGLGARLELQAGGVVQRREISATRSYQSQSELEATFGLGASTAVDSLVVTWPDGTRQEVAVEGVDRLVVVEKAS